jgi:hypothetical protein
MRTPSKLALTTFATLATLSIAVSVASARRIELSNQRFLEIWTLIRWEFAGTATVECPLTLEGSYHSKTLSKVSGQLIGYITSAKIRGGRAECNGTGTSRVLTETLPWHVRYSRFVGTLPSITGIVIQVVGLSVSLDPESFLLPNCLLHTEPAHPNTFISEIVGTQIRTVRADETQTIPIEGLCELGGSASFRGTGELFLQGSTTTRITDRLVA